MDTDKTVEVYDGDGEQRPTPLQDMLNRVLPDRTQEEQDSLLWSITAYPFNGLGIEDIKMYEDQILKALAARPDDPRGWAEEQMSAAMDRAREKEAEAKKDA